jgi:predicted hydrocarbon binding protein
MDRELVYVIHSDASIASHVSDSLRESDFKVVAMSTEEEAEGVLTGHQFVLPDAILTPLGDLESGDSILIKLFTSNPLMEQIPLVILATHDEDQRRRALRMGLLSVIFPPYDQEEVTLTTQLAIEKHKNEQLLFGSLSQLSVPDLLQTAEVGRRSGMITFQHNGHKGRVWLRDGLVVNAEIEGVCSDEVAVYVIALWDTGTFEANFGTVDVDDAIAILPSELLLEAMRRYDEGELPTIEELSGAFGAVEQRPFESVAETSLILLNVASSYALNHIEPTLVESRLEKLRITAAQDHPLLKKFRVDEGGVVSFVGDESDSAGIEGMPDAVGTWVREFFATLESALAWRFSPTRLAHITAPWSREIEGFQFSDSLGTSAGDEDLGDDSVLRAGPMQELLLPCGCFVIDSRTVIDRYSPYGSQTIPRDPASFSGQPLLSVLPPKMSEQIKRLLKNLDEAKGDEGRMVTSELELELGYRTVNTRISLVRSSLDGRFILTVNRVRGDDLQLSPDLARDAAHGTLSDGLQRILAANDDFFSAFNSLFSKGLSYRRHELLHRFGKQWGLRHVLRIERLVQREYGMTLREVESQMAIEALSESMGVLGLGSFDVDLSHRDNGVLVTIHRNSPFPTYGSTTSEGACSILAGFYAALLSYLSGRQLAAREVACSRTPERPCRFVVATEERLTKLLVARPGSADHDLLAEIGAESALLTVVAKK